MRDFLTGLAIILIVVLTTVLVAPYFVDWNGQRSFLEARLSHALGQKVTIGGNIDLKLLPTPYLVLDQVVVGDEDGPVRVGIHHLDLELTVAPLLHGAFDITEARLEEPTIRLALEQDRTLPALPKAPAFEAEVRFDRIKVSDGTLAVLDPQSGRTFTFDHLDFDADAGSFAGPFKVKGAAGPTGRRTKFHLATTQPEKGRARARFVIEETPSHLGVELDGSVDLANTGGAMRQSFDGTILLLGRFVAGEDKEMPWRLSGPFKADPKQAVIDGGELRLGGEDANLTLKAKATASYEAAPKFAFDLSAKQLDIDRLAGAPTDSTKPPPPNLPDLATLRRMIAATLPPAETQLDLSLENATYAGETLSDIDAHLRLGGDGAAPLKISGDGPGGSHVAVDGQLKPDANFSGDVDLSADNLPRAVAWFASIAPWSPWRADGLPFKAVKVAGHVTAGPATIDGVHLTLGLDRSVLKGTADIAFGGNGQAPKVTADLRADALDLDGLPSLDALSDNGPFDLDLRLDAKAIKVSRLGEGALDTGHIRLAATRAGHSFELKEFRADDLGGATIQATAKLDPSGGALALTLDAAHLEAAAGLIRQLAPGAMSEALVARAPVLAPAKLRIEATLAPRSDRRLAPSRLTIQGKLAKTTIDATAKPEGSATALTATLDAPDSGALLGQIGVSALPMEVVGAGRITLAARGTTGTPFDTKLAAKLGTTTLDLTGRFDLLSTNPSGSGTAQLKSPDVTPLLQTLAVAFPDMTGRIGADVTGRLSLNDSGAALDALDGRLGGIGTHGSLRYSRGASDAPAFTGTLELDSLRLASLVGLSLGPEQPAAAGSEWSKQPFAVGLIDPPRVSVTLKAKALEIMPGVSASNAALDLNVAPNLVTLGDAKADLDAGRLDGRVTLRRDGRQASVEGRIALDGVGLRTGSGNGGLSGKLDFAGSGTSAFALVSSLAGSGEATLRDLNIPRSDPRALPKVFDDVEADLLTVDQDVVVRAFDDSTKSPLYVDQQVFDLGLASGSLRFTPKDATPKDAPAPADEPVASRIEATLDLATLGIDTRIEETLRALPKNWAGPPPSLVVALRGPLDKPVRTFDVSGFLNAVASRALARESARIEAYEFDIRERAFFNTRLQSERRREEERRKAEDDARKAEAERKARLEAARQDRLRREAKAREDAERAARERDQNNPAPSGAPEPPKGNDPPPPPVKDPSALGRY